MQIVDPASFTFSDPYLRHKILFERRMAMQPLYFKACMHELLNGIKGKKPSRAHHFLLRNLPYDEKYSQFRPANGNKYILYREYYTSSIAGVYYVSYNSYI